MAMHVRILRLPLAFAAMVTLARPPALASSASAAPDLLVLMHGSGKVERYDLRTGRHRGTFIRGIPLPNCLLAGPDGRWYISTGLPGTPGSVVMFDGRDGRRLGTFTDAPVGQAGHLARATGMAWYQGDLLVASQGDGKVKRFDGRSGAWKADVAAGSPAGITQIAVSGDRLVMADFGAFGLRASDMTGAASPAPLLSSLPGHAPWGLAIDASGNAFQSTNQNRILRFDGKQTLEWAGAGGGLGTPVSLAIGPDGLLYAANLSGNEVTLWRTDAPNPGVPVRRIGGPEMLSPISIAFTDAPFEEPMQIGNFRPKPSNTGKDWTPTGRTVYNLAASRSSAAIVAFGLDTEGGDRAKTNLIREPIRLILTLDDGTRVDSAEAPAACRLSRGRAEYGFDAVAGAHVDWTVALARQDLTMRFALSGPNAARVAQAELLIPFDPRAMGTTVLAEEWGAEGVVKAPLIISALDMGQLRLSGEEPNERLDCLFTGSRHYKKIDLRVSVLDPATTARTVVFRPARLARPNRRVSAAEWARVRRGLISLLQITPYMKPQEDGSGWLGSPGGITGNNVISDPVSCNMDRNLQWLAGMGGAARIMGINLNKVARKTIEFWLNQRMNADGSLDYVLQTGNISADANTGVLNSATDYYLSTRDRQFVEANRAVLARAADYMIARDLDGDGLIETFRDGNGRNQFGDTGYDTISSGWKNAMVNGQAYKSLLGVARMMRDIGDAAAADRYADWAVRMRRVYNRTFFDAAKRRYIWWIGQDGKRHDYANPIIQENAALFGIADCLEQDAGIKVTARDVMQQLWDDLASASYFDSAKGKTIRYMAPELGDYTGLYWGIPGNLEDVPDEYNFADYGKHEFPYYCNGGIFPQDTVPAIMAFSSVGMKEKADTIKREIFRRQHQGILPNGSGFYMGVVNEPGKCYSILKWDGTPTDYEGIISRDCAFLQSAILTEDPAKALFDKARNRGNQNGGQ